MSNEKPVLTPSQIWKGDQFNRMDEADQLLAYIESVAGRAAERGDSRAFTIAIDGGYGIGKTFFLTRFAQHLSLNHPVAFVDAWADDLADEPLTALAATLKEALDPFVHKPEMAGKVRSFMSKTGKVMKIAGKGLLRRGLTVALTGGAVSGIEEVLEGTTEAVGDALKDGSKDLIDGAVGDTAGAIRDVTAHDLMEKRVSDFEEGRAAVKAMKDSLRAIVDGLKDTDKHPPIVIIIDELDRCRPTYAIKLLEEIKHLFDVPGLVFILGIHGDQLSHSIRGAYGPSFDGRAYLRRFIDRKYSLAQPDLSPLLHQLCDAAGISDDSLIFPPISPIKGQHLPRLATMIALYMQTYGLQARDAFQLIDILQTALAIAQHKPLYGAYLLPLAIAPFQSDNSGPLARPVKEGSLFFPPSSPGQKEPKTYTFEEYAESMASAARLTTQQIINATRDEATYHALDRIAAVRDFNTPRLPIWDPARYPDLLAAVGRFDIRPS